MLNLLKGFIEFMVDIAKQSYGIKVSQLGYDSLTAPDHKLLFNSSWPSLAIAFSVVGFDLADLSSVEQVQLFTTGPPYYRWEHGLDYPPVPVLYTSSNGYNFGRSSKELNSDDTYVYLDSQLDTEDEIYYTIHCYNVDLSKDVTYPLPEPGTSLDQTDDNYGLKIIKEGKDINSTDYRDFIIHTKCQSPAVFKIVTTRDTGERTLTVPLDTSYTPIFLPFLLISAGVDGLEKDLYLMTSSSVNNITEDGLVYDISGTTLLTGVYPGFVILRDPLFPPNPEEIAY